MQTTLLAGSPCHCVEHGRQCLPRRTKENFWVIPHPQRTDGPRQRSRYSFCRARGRPRSDKLCLVTDPSCHALPLVGRVPNFRICKYGFTWRAAFLLSRVFICFMFLFQAATSLTFEDDQVPSLLGAISASWERVREIVLMNVGRVSTHQGTLLNSVVRQDAPCPTSHAAESRTSAMSCRSDSCSRCGVNCGARFRI